MILLLTGKSFEKDFKKKQKKLVYQQEICEYRFKSYGSDEFVNEQAIYYFNSKTSSGWNRWVNGKLYSNKKEAALFSAHKQEYGNEYKLKLRSKRSNRILAKPWNEEKTSFLDKTKSWKDSTKRKKQYYKNNQDDTI